MKTQTSLPLKENRIPHSKLPGDPIKKKHHLFKNDPQGNKIILPLSGTGTPAACEIHKPLWGGGNPAATSTARAVTALQTVESRPQTFGDSERWGLSKVPLPHAFRRGLGSCCVSGFWWLAGKKRRGLSWAAIMRRRNYQSQEPPVRGPRAVVSRPQKPTTGCAIGRLDLANLSRRRTWLQPTTW